jgi:LysR family transcriptional regulator (chromosome initiation inhibitor)
MMSELPLDLVRTLLVAVDEGTFDAAARASHVTPSAVSQRVKALEQRVGRVLLVRSKPLRLTESGEIVVRLARQIARLEGDARAELGMAGSAGPACVSIAVNADSLATWFLPALAAVPDDVDVCFDLRRADQDHTARLLREGVVMAAVTSAPEPVQGCTARALGHMRYRAMAAPAFVARQLAGGAPQEVLGDVPVVVFDRDDDLQDRFLREFTRATCSPPRHYVPASETFVEAVVAGLGWGMIPEAQADARRDRGELVDLAVDRPVDVPLYWQQWRLDSPALAAVANAVTRAFAETQRGARARQPGPSKTS